jgi:hypothetical protein
MLKVKSFYVWWVTTLAALTALFWMVHNGILMEIWEKDHTFLTSIIGLLLVYTTACTGYLAFNIKNISEEVRQKLISRCFFLSQTAMGLAIIGASIAIILLLGVGFSESDLANLSQAILAKWSQLAPAFYPNAVGLAVALFIKVQTYFIAEDYLDE